MTDFTNPCAVLDALRNAHFDLATGKQVASVSHDGRMVTYSKGDLPTLERAIARYEGLCAAQTGKRRQFAIRGGGI